MGFKDLALLNAKAVTTRLGFTAQLVMYRATARFGRAASDFSNAVIAYLSEQIGAAPIDLVDYDWVGRSGRRHRSEILDYLGLRRARQQDMRDAAAWTGSELYPLGLPTAEMMERLLGWFVARKVAGPEEEVMTPLIITDHRAFEDNVLQTIGFFLSPEHRGRLDASLADEDGTMGFSGLKADPGQPNLELLLVSRAPPLGRRCGSLEFHRAEIANGRVIPARVVESFDIIEHISRSLISCPVGLAGDPLGFQR